MSVIAYTASSDILCVLHCVLTADESYWFTLQ